MTPENDDRRPPQEPDTQPEKNKSPLDALNDTAVGQKASQALKTVTGTAAKVQRNPVIATYCAPQNVSMTGWAISSARPSPTSRSCR